MQGALAGTFVVDVSTGVAGAYCTKLLADLGADVLKVEPPEGDALRRMGPFPGGLEDPERSGLFLHLNANKRGIVLDLDSPAGRAELLRLARRADLLVESFRAEGVEALGLTYRALSGVNARLVATSVTPFGRWGPYAGWKSDEVVEWAMGGYMYFGGDPERAPVLVPGHQAALHAGQHAAIGSLAALHHARRTGLGQQVEVSHLESMLLAHAWLSVSWTHEGQIMKRAPSSLVRTLDGWVSFFAPLRSENFFLLIERYDLMEDPGFATPAARMRQAADLLPLLRQWCAGQTAAAVQTRAQELRIACTYAVDVAGLFEEPHMKARDWYATFDHPRAGRLTYPGFPYKLSETPCEITRPAPLLGEHAGAAPAAARGAPAAAGGANGGGPEDGGPPLPLAGVKVVEVTANWAGPLTGRHLGDLGADVIKVEFATRPATRATRWPGGWRAPRHFNRSGYFNKLNRNKRDVCIDLSVAEGKAAFLKLIEWADVLVENNSARVMPNFGLGYETLQARNPRLIMVSMAGFGASGPYRDFVAYGANIELSCGLVSLTGYGPGEYCNTSSFYADPVAGNHGTIAVLAALEYHRRTGRGQFIDVSLNEGAAGMFAEALMDFSLNGVVRKPMGARSPVHAPQGVYRCFGEDSWLVLTVRDDAEWLALCAVIGRTDLAGRPDLGTPAGRQAAHDEIDAAVTAWTAEREHREAAAALQRAGVPAGPVLANWEIVTDAHLFERGFLVYVKHPEAGVLPYPGFGWKLSRTPARVRRHAPMFAEHNPEVFGGVLGLSEAEVEALYASGATADEPQYPPGSVLSAL